MAELAEIDLDRIISDNDLTEENSKKTIQNEKRGFERKSLRGKALISIHNHGPILVKTIDISEGGIAVVAERNPKPETACVIQVEIPLHDGKKYGIHSKAVVMHSIYSRQENGFKIGLKFLDLSDEKKHLIQNFIYP